MFDENNAKIYYDENILLKEENEKSWRCKINYEIVSKIFDKYSEQQ